MVLCKSSYLTFAVFILTSSGIHVFAQNETTTITSTDAEATIFMAVNETTTIMNATTRELFENNTMTPVMQYTTSSQRMEGSATTTGIISATDTATDVESDTTSSISSPNSTPGLDGTTTSLSQSYISTTPQPPCKAGTWDLASNCSRACGGGCPLMNNQSRNPLPVCDAETGYCVTDKQDCTEGYTGLDCANPICSLGCNGGQCLAPELCQLCPIHFSSGRTCRNIRLDGFLRGSLSTFAILTGVVVILSVSSKWYVRRKVQQKAPPL